MHDEERRQAVLGLLSGGRSDREIARLTGVPRSTVGHWRRHPPACRALDDGASPWLSNPRSYCYALGLYLGDGHIVRRGRTARLCVRLDAVYPAVAEEARGAFAVTFPAARVSARHVPSRGTIDIQLSSAALPRAFPQCGPGRKHERTIALADWQSEMTHSRPRELIRGLIHSDGCRTVNRFSTRLPSGRIGRYEYARYFFSNLSADIRGIFCEHCDLLGIRWTQSNSRNVSVAQRDSVALLDEFVGPKA